MSTNLSPALFTSVPLARTQRAIVEKADESLWHFVKMAFPVIGLGGDFIDGRHIHVICEHLQAVSKGEIRNLCVNVPPGYMKSLLVCVFWPVWDWLQYPERKFLFGSYDASLSRRDSARSLKLLQSEWFVERWGHYVMQRRPAESDYHNRYGGERFATSVDGRVTGRHYNVHVVDDPIKPKDANNKRPSKLMLEKAATWWNETISTRVFDRKTLRRVIIMQRLHSDDLAGLAKRSGDYDMLTLPLEYEHKHAVPADWRTTEGELLWPEKDGPEEVDKAKKDLGSVAAVAAQLQQRPTPAGGLVFKQKHFRYWHYDKGVIGPDGIECQQLPRKGARWAQSWDCAFKDSDGSDRVAWGVFQQHRADFYLMAWGANIIDFTHTLSEFKRVTERYPKAVLKLVEDKANGTALENTMRRSVAGIRMINPQGGKMARALNAQPIIETGHFFLPHPDIALQAGLEPSLNELIDELTGFPFSSYDDLVDMITQALTHMATGYEKLRDAMKKFKAGL